MLSEEAMAFGVGDDRPGAVTAQPANVLGSVGGVAIDVPSKLQRRKGGIVAKVAVLPRLVGLPVFPNIGELDLGARQHRDADAFGAKVVVQASDVRKDVVTEEAQVPVTVRRGDNVSNAV